ncbi:DJ-1/PfpI family protein [Streptomyces gamaensis]|uniref:DJ-1/PfpI family protein n=1 Tax=Streptomyces gamaensis TaxID=1763542 RepID=A0ABW0YVB9_9ACTN
MPKAPTQRIAILLYPGFTALDAVGPYEMLSRIPGTETVLVAERPGPVANDNRGFALVARAGLDEVSRPAVVLVPGGRDVSGQLRPGPVLEWLREADRHSTWTTSVCTGSLILGAAGLLAGRRATSHWLYREDLSRYGAVPTRERVVTDGKYMTAAGVSAGIDMGLTLAGLLAGDRTAQEIQLVAEYDPHPPYDAGSPEKAPAGLVARWRAAKPPLPPV